jgi:hypothetical protein
MKIISAVLIILGIVGVIVFGIQAINQSESFSVLGADIAVSKADWTPLISSAVVLVVGVVLRLIGKK